MSIVWAHTLRPAQQPIHFHSGLSLASPPGNDPALSDDASVSARPVTCPHSECLPLSRGSATAPARRWRRDLPAAETDRAFPSTAARSTPAGIARYFAYSCSSCTRRRNVVPCGVRENAVINTSRSSSMEKTDGTACQSASSASSPPR